MIFLDIEASSRDTETAEIYEIAWAIDDQPVYSIILPHTGLRATKEALSVNHYAERGLDNRERWCGPESLTLLRTQLTGAILAGAGPHFDDRLLINLFGYRPHSHRLHDVCTYAAGPLGFERSHGLAATVERANRLGADIEQPDHTAGRVVEAVRGLHYFVARHTALVRAAFTREVERLS